MLLARRPGEVLSLAGNQREEELEAEVLPPSVMREPRREEQRALAVMERYPSRVVEAQEVTELLERALVAAWTRVTLQEVALPLHL